MSFEFDQVQGKYGQSMVETAVFGNDGGVHAEFYRRRVPLEGATLAAAKAAQAPLYTEADYLRIQFPGDRNKVWDQEVLLVGTPSRPSDPDRFPRQWAAYKSGLAMDGTPLSDLAALTEGDVAKYRALHVHTVENLASISDGNLGALGLGGMEARTAARAFLMNVSAKKADHTDEIAQLRAQIAALTADRSEDAPRRGRPPKADERAAA